MTCSQDGSIRTFDTRRLEHSTIIYESRSPILRILPSPTYYLSAFGVDKKLLVFDLRMPREVLEEFQCNSELIGMGWSDEETLFVGLNSGQILLKRIMNGSWVACDGDPVNGLSVCRSIGNGCCLSYTAGKTLTSIDY